MIKTLTSAIYKHGYLLLVAVWLYTFSFILTNYWAYDSSPSKVRDKLENKLIKSEQAVSQIKSDTVLLESLLTDTLSKKKQSLLSQPFGLYLYTLNDVGSPILNYWNSNVYTISQGDIQQRDGYYFASRQNGDQEIIKQSINLNGKPIIMIAVIPIRWDYFIENKYLHKGFDGFPKLSDLYEISNDANALPIINSLGYPIFKIKEKNGHIYAQYDVISILLRLLFIFSLILFLNKVAINIVEKHGLPTGAFLLVGVIFIIRIITYNFSFPFDYSRLSLFDPSIYASSFLHPSLGHLLINAVLFFWIVSFWKFNSLNYSPSILYRTHKWLKYINIIFLLIAVFTVANITGTLVQDSQISFDVTHFFSLNIFSVVSFIILAFLALGLYHLSHIILRPLFALNTPILRQLLVASVTGLVYISFTIGATTNLKILVLFWLIGYLILLYYRREDIGISIQKSSFFLFWVMIFALSITLLISWQNRVVDISERKKMAERLILQNDANGENVLSIAVSNINASSIAANYNRLSTSESENKFIKDSILNENFSGYLNRFETSIYTFNQFYQPLFNDDTTLNYAILTSIISVRSKPTIEPNLYAWENGPNRVSYLYSIPISTKDSTLGFFILVAKPKKYKSEALYPVLFSQTDEETNWSGQSQYAQAIYINGRLESKFNDYDFPLKINTNHQLPYEFSLHKNGDSEELWYNASNGKTVIIAKANTQFIEVLTLFAYLFFTFLVVIGIFHIANFLVRAKLKGLSFLSSLRLSMQSQIHATVIFISIFSFVVIGGATISFFINRFNTNNSQRLAKSIEIIANEIYGRVQQIQSQKSDEDTLLLIDENFGNKLERDITEVSETHNVDINFYSLSGNLISTTQPHIYNKQLLNTHINPTAFFHLKHDDRSRYMQNESIGDLNYLSMYMPVLDNAGNAYAYINIPYLNSQLELNQEISSFIATIINLNAFIFLIAGAIAFLITQRVVNSFSLIANKMKEVNIGKKNEAIIWDRDDEIGELVTEYNKMVQKLERSASALARSEREGAWREMAKQVAHEIKNPLTPMKLSIQYLQRAIDNDQPNAKELAQKVATTLIDQIDQLAKIAGDFSQFANIENAVLEDLDISKLLENIIQLYQQTESVYINYEKMPPMLILGDKTQLNRLFTNLLKNAIESVEAKNTCVIDVIQVQENEFIKITIRDNGKGIPSSIHERIFQPNFTTKTSGTGLGLAISKGIVEKLGGKICFRSEEGAGTSFEIKLPII